MIRRTGPAWAFGLLGLVGELMFAPVVFAATVVIGVVTYLLLDAPWTRIRAQQRPRFVSVRILYLNTLILTGFWLAMMFAFSAADPSMSTNVSQRLPALLEAATAQDFPAVIHAQQPNVAQPGLGTMATASTWFDVFLHGLISSLTVNLILYGLVVARRRSRVLHGLHVRRDRLHYDAKVGLFVDGEGSSAR
ncbi:MAG: hypothetical protein ABR498_09220 [Candidatus Dormibacteria bacterium]